MRIENKEILKQLMAIRDNGESKQERNRAHAILLSHNNIHIDEIAKILDVTTRSVFGWFQAFKDHEIESLKCKSGRGRKALLNVDEHKEIIERHIKNHPHQPKKAFALSVDEIGIKISYSTFKLFFKKTQIQL